HCPGRSRAGGERGRGCAAFERADSFFQRLPVWIVVARVHESARVSSFHVAFEGRGKMNGRRDGAGCGIDALAGMHGESFNFHVSAERLRIRYPLSIYSTSRLRQGYGGASRTSL